MTEDQKKRLGNIILTQEIASYEDLKAAIGGDTISLNSMDEVVLWIIAFRFCLQNSVEQTGNELKILLGDDIRETLNSIASRSKVLYDLMLILESMEAKKRG